MVRIKSNSVVHVKTGIVAQRNQLYAWLWTYKKRRDKLREKHGIKSKNQRFNPNMEAYNKDVARINQSIINLTARIKRIEQLSDRIKVLYDAVVKFTGTPLKGVKSPKNVKNGALSTDIGIAKALYYKYGLENGIENSQLRSYIGKGYYKEAARYRTMLTKSFATNTKNKEIWLNFKRFMKNHTNYQK